MYLSICSLQHAGKSECYLLNQKWPFFYLAVISPQRRPWILVLLSLHVHSVVKIRISVTLINIMFTQTCLCKSVAVNCPVCRATGWQVNYVLVRQGFSFVELKEPCPQVNSHSLAFRCYLILPLSGNWLLIPVAFSNNCVLISQSKKGAHNPLRTLMPMKIKGLLKMCKIEPKI